MSSRQLTAGYSVAGASLIEDIKTMLMGQLERWPDCPEQVAWPNIAFDPPNPPAVWIRPTLMWAQSSAAAVGVGAQNLQPGVFQVSIFAPPEVGDGEAIRLAGSLIKFFKRGTRFAVNGSTDIVIRRGWPAGAPIDEPGWFHLPVSLEWIAYGAN